MPFVSGGGISIVPTAIAVVALSFLSLASVVGIFVVIVVANRADPDPTGRRPLAVYLFAVAFFSVFVVLFGTYAMVSGVVQLMGTHPGVAAVSRHPVGDAVTRVVVLGGLVVVVAAVLLTVSLRRGLRLPEPGPGGGPVARVVQSYAASVSFVAVIIAAASIVVFVYQALRILAPGVFELTETRIVAARTLLSTLYLALGATAILATHARLLPDSGWRVRTRPRGDAAFTPSTPAS